MEAIVSTVFSKVCMDNTFPDIHYHISQTGVTDNHVFLLIKAVTRNYLKIRLHHIAKDKNMLKHDRVRKMLSELILFKNQKLECAAKMC